MAFSLLSDVMGSRQKLQLAMWAYRSDTCCIEMSASLDDLTTAKAPKIIAGYSAGQQKAPDRSGAFRDFRICFRATAPPVRHQYR
jgi:hypothetical protein